MGCETAVQINDPNGQNICCMIMKDTKMSKKLRKLFAFCIHFYCSKRARLDQPESGPLQRPCLFINCYEMIKKPVPLVSLCSTCQREKV
jgi:hypothetical protein